MNNEHRSTRRALLHKIGGLVTAGMLAGCGTKSQRSTVTPTPSGDGGSSDGDLSQIGRWLADVDNFNRIRNKTGQDEVKVKVGVDNGGRPIGFGPPAIQVDLNTRIVWEWTGRGGEHHVGAEDGAQFRSELTAEEGYTFEWTYDTGDNVTYYCINHRSEGMKGAIKPAPGV